MKRIQKILESKEYYVHECHSCSGRFVFNHVVPEEMRVIKLGDYGQFQSYDWNSPQPEFCPFCGAPIHDCQDIENGIKDRHDDRIEEIVSQVASSIVYDYLSARKIAGDLLECVNDHEMAEMVRNVFNDDGKQGAHQ